MHDRYSKTGSANQIQNQKKASIQVRPNLYLDTAQPCHSVPETFPQQALCLDRRGLGEVCPPDGLEQRVVEAKVGEARDGPRRHRARHVHAELVLQVDHLQ